MKQSPKLPAEKRKAQLIGAAAKVFAQRGYIAATTEDISREAGLTKGALYFHFKNKEEIFLAVVKDHIDEQVKAATKFLDEKDNLERIIEKVIRTSFKMMEREKHFTFDFWAQAFNIPRVRKYLTEVHKIILERFSGYIMSHSNLKKKEAEALVWLVHSIRDGLLVQEQCYMSGGNQKEIINQVVKMFKIYLSHKK
jgi:AcrR family transcriptional regulator